MDLGLRGKKAIVTGGTRGIGRAIADLLVEEGCDIGICARTAAQIEEAVAAFKAKGVKALGASVDVADGDPLTRFVKSAAEALGGLDIFISNVGALGGSNDEASWKRGFEIDVLGTVRGCETAVPFLEKSGAGAIVVVGSTAAVEVVGPRRAYSGLKAALLPYIKGLARDLASKRVRANGVSPGSVYFKGGTWDLMERKNPERYRQALARNPTGRMATPEEVANAVVFLASPRASFISGINLICDGGMTQRVQF
ncbi:MAG: SDR family oxidoreductase [Deltaproteobacteria bacterium]|jgi:3-oxoacyl-[acyl-carrier protein] reductase|nr:SDR family oxidoreductase [Deltaproteobacteria bacterium]